MAIKEKLASLVVDINAKLDPLKGQMKKALAILKRGFSSMVRMAKIAAIGIGVAMAAAFVLITRAAMKQEDALFRLQAALSLTGHATKSVIADFKKFAAEIQKVTIYGDEFVLDLMAQLKALGVHTTRLKAATKMVIGLSAATGRATSTMIMATAAVEEGDTELLRRYIPALRTVTDETEKMRLVTELAANGFKLAEARAETTSGGLWKMWNAIGDLAEAFGEPLLGPIRKVTKAIKDFVEKSTAKLQQFTKFLATAFKIKLEMNEGDVFKTIKEFLSVFWKTMKIKTVEWAKNLGDLLVPVFERLGFIVGDAIKSAIPKAYRSTTVADLKPELAGQKNLLAIMINSRQRMIDANKDGSFDYLIEKINPQIEEVSSVVKGLQKQIDDLTPTMTSWATIMLKIGNRTKEANDVVETLFNDMVDAQAIRAKIAAELAKEKEGGGLAGLTQKPPFAPTPPEAAKAGLVGFQAAWGQVATGTQRTEEAQLRALEKIARSTERSKEIAEQGQGMQSITTPRYR